MTLTRVLLICGPVAAGWFLAMDIAAGMLFYSGYDYGAQQVSELSAIGAPSREFWMAMGYPYAALSAAFALGVWQAGTERASVRVTAVLLGLFALNSLLWGLVAPMHMRGTEFSGTDAAHIGFTIAAVVLMVAFMSTGALALGRGFRSFSALTAIAMLAAGAVVGTQIGAIAAGQPTPFMGLVERISVYAPAIWIAVYGVLLLRGAAGSGLGRGGAVSRAEPRRHRSSVPRLSTRNDFAAARREHLGR